MLIFAVSMGLWSFRLLRPLELKTLSFTFLQRQVFSYRSLTEVDVPFLTIPVYDRVSDETYLNLAQQVVRELKKAGAKAVIVPIPENLRANPHIFQRTQEIARDSIAIFGVTPYSPAFLLSSGLRLDDRRQWWVGSPFFNRLKVPWGVISAVNTPATPIIQFVPTGFRESSVGTATSDVAVLALRRFFDLSGDAEPQPYASRLSFGSASIQIARDGLSYLKFRYNARNSVAVWVSVDETSDSIHFYPAWSTKVQTKDEIQKAWEKHRGKIVLLDWITSRMYQYPNYGWMYTQIFGSAFYHSFVSVHNEWNTLLITTLVMLLSVFSYALRNGYTVLLSFVLFVASIGVSVWLLANHDVLFDPIYVIAPIILCGVIFPIVKTTGEKKIAQATIKSLEEENKRILDLLRRTQAGPHQ
jgi:hypothetical protein